MGFISDESHLWDSFLLLDIVTFYLCNDQRVQRLIIIIVLCNDARTLSYHYHVACNMQPTHIGKLANIYD